MNIDVEDHDDDDGDVDESTLLYQYFAHSTTDVNPFVPSSSSF